MARWKEDQRQLVTDLDGIKAAVEAIDLENSNEIFILSVIGMLKERLIGTDIMATIFTWKSITICVGFGPEQ